MLKFDEFCIAESAVQDEQAIDLTYPQYCLFLEHVEGSQDRSRIDEDFGPAGVYASQKASNLIAKAREDIKSIARELKIGFKAVVLAFKNPSIYRILRAFRFNFSALFKAISEASTLILYELNDVLTDLGNSLASDELDMHVEYIEKFIDRHPSLHKLTGVTLAGAMIYFWLNMTFVGNFSYDMNLKNAAYAVAGKYTLEDFLKSKNGRSMLVLFGTGAFVTFPWLGSTYLNLALAVIYTGLIIARETGLAKNIRSKIHRE